MKDIYRLNRRFSIGMEVDGLDLEFVERPSVWLSVIEPGCQNIINQFRFDGAFLHGEEAVTDHKAPHDRQNSYLFLYSLRFTSSRR